MWYHIYKIVSDEMNNGLKLISKLTLEYVQLNPYSNRKVHLATQVLSESVSNIPINYYPDTAHSTAEFCKFMDMSFGCLNVRNQYEGNTKRKEYLQPYGEIDDARFTWRENEFFSYLDNWKESTENRSGNFSQNARSRMFLPCQTYEELKITTHLSIKVVKFLLLQGMPFVLTERLNQDCLEEYFGKHRVLDRRNDNPDLKQFGYQSYTLRMQRSVAPITGNTKGGHKQNRHVSWSKVNK